MAAQVSSPRGRYAPLRTLSVPTDSVNCLQFSADGKWLAVGGDDGRLTIFDSQSYGCPEMVIVAAAPVTAILWHPSRPYSLFVGQSDGDLVLYDLGPQVSIQVTVILCRADVRVA